MKQAEPKLTFEQWAKLGSDLKKIDASLSDIWFKLGTVCMMTKREQTETIIKIDKSMCKARSIYENAMFRQIGKDYKQSSALMNVFYSSPTGLEPANEPERKVKAS